MVFIPIVWLDTSSSPRISVQRAPLRSAQPSARDAAGLRAGLAVIFGLVALTWVALGVTLGNPLFEEQVVHGLIGVNTLIPAYLLPAAVLMVGALRLDHLWRWLRLLIGAPGALLALLWLGLVIRHAWQGGTLMHTANGITDGELLEGVRYSANSVSTHSLVMRSRSGTIRTIRSEHKLSKLRAYSAVDFDR